MSHFSRYFVLWMGCLALAPAFAEEPAGLEGLAKTVKYEDGFHVEVVDEVTFFRQLQKFDSREDFCLRLHESLKSESDSERLAALKVIEKFEERLQFSETQLRTFVQILDTDESPTCRCLAMDILVHFRAKECIPSLLRALEDSSPDIASSAAWALGELAPPSEEVLQALLRHTADSREVVTSVTIDVYVPQPVVAQASLNALEKLAVGNVEVYDSILREQIPPEVWKSFDEKKLETFFERIASPDLREEEFWRYAAEAGLDRFPASDSLPVVILFTLRPEDPRSLYLYLSRKLTKAKGDISNVYPSDFYDVPQTRPVFFAMRTCWQHREARDVDWHKIEWKFIRQSFRKELNKNEFESRCRDALDFLEGVDDSYFRAWWTRDFLYGLPAWQPEYFELYEPLLMSRFRKDLKSKSMEHNFVQRLAAILPPDEFARFVLDSFEMPSLSGFFAPTCLWIDTATVKRIRREAREDFGMPTIIPERKFCISIPSPQRLLESLERQESAYPAACQSRDYLKFKSRLRVLAKYGME